MARHQGGGVMEEAFQVSLIRGVCSWASVKKVEGSYPQWKCLGFAPNVTVAKKYRLAEKVREKDSKLGEPLQRLD